MRGRDFPGSKESMMNKFLLAGAALAALATLPAAAQPGGEGPGAFERPQTRAAVEAQVAARFASADSNRDGFLGQDELRAGAEAARAKRGEGHGERRGQSAARRGSATGGFGGRGLAMMDLDHDGRVALAEARQAALQRFDRVDSNRDGSISPEERQAARAARQGRSED
jgi:hypothetical protein